MSVAPNPVDGALIRPDGTLKPIRGDDPSTEATWPPDDRDAAVPLAMTAGRQMSAARSA